MLLGPRSKPHLCALCAQAPFSHGFTPDWCPPNPKLALLLEGPGETEILRRTPLCGRAGDFTFHAFLRPLGLTRDDVIISNALRCRMEENDYPQGTVRSRAERCCRQYDWYHGDGRGELVAGGLADWDPHVFVLTLHPAAVFREPAYFFLVRRDFEKAWRFSESGQRVCVLCGDKAASLVFPIVEGTGGVTYWRGHVFEGSLRTVERPRTNTSIVSEIRAFKPVTARSWGGKRRKVSKVQESLF